MEKIAYPKPWEKGVRLWLLWLMVAGLMGMIFIFSAQPATQSALLSGGIVNVLVTNFVANFHSISLSEQAMIIQDWSFMVRKTAHATIYTILGFVTMLAVYKTAKRKPFEITFSKPIQTSITLGICLFYAMSDEIHQRFVPGRSSELRDVMIDLAGITLGIAIAWVWLTYKKRRYVKMAQDLKTES